MAAAACKNILGIILKHRKKRAPIKPYVQGSIVAKQLCAKAYTIKYHQQP
jgi:hypothetical protein